MSIYKFLLYTKNSVVAGNWTKIWMLENLRFEEMIQNIII